MRGHCTALHPPTAPQPPANRPRCSAPDDGVDAPVHGPLHRLLLEPLQQVAARVLGPRRPAALAGELAAAAAAGGRHRGHRVVAARAACGAWSRLDATLHGLRAAHGRWQLGAERPAGRASGEASGCNGLTGPSGLQAASALRLSGLSDRHNVP